MKIAMIGHKRIPSREGGVEIVVERLSTSMVGFGNEVSVYNRKGNHISGSKYNKESNYKKKEYKGVKIITVFTFQNKKLNAIVYSFNATFLALFKKYDVIHFHAEGPCAMLWIPHLFGIRTIATIHGLDWQREKWGNFATWFLKFGEKVAVKYADEIIVLSKNVQKYFMDTYNRKTVYISNGIEKPTIRKSTNIKEKYGLKKDEYILFLARIVPEKGLHYLIDAYKGLNTTKKLVVAGGSSHSNEYMQKIKEMVKDNPNILLTDFVEGKVLEELYSNAYIYVLPSDIEGMPISLLEAMSYGNCCLVSDIHENIEVIKDKGISFIKGSVSDLKEQLVYLLDNREIVNKYKSEASDYICKRYNWDDVVDKTINLYKKK